MFTLSEDDMFFPMIWVLHSVVIPFTQELALIWMEIQKNAGKPRKASDFALLSE